jgi:hypothetical protein
MITTDVKAAPPSVVNSLTTTVSAGNTDDAPDGVQDNSNDGLQEAGAEESKTGNGIVLLHHKFFCKRRVLMVMQNHCSLNLFVLPVDFLFLLCSYSAL